MTEALNFVVTRSVLIRLARARPAGLPGREWRWAWRRVLRNHSRFTRRTDFASRGVPLPVLERKT